MLSLIVDHYLKNALKYTLSKTGATSQIMQIIEPYFAKTSAFTNKTMPNSQPTHASEKSIPKTPISVAGIF